MSRRIDVSLAPTASDADLFATSQTPAAGGAQNLTLTNSAPAAAQHVTITCAGADAGRTFTVTGTDRQGAALTESISGANTATTAGTKNFLTVTQIQVDADTAGAITAGVDGTAESQWIPVNYRSPNWSGAGFGVELSSGASLTYKVQHTFHDLFASGFAEDDATTYDHETVTGKTAADDGNYAYPPSGVRLSITAHTTGSATLRYLEAS